MNRCCIEALALEGVRTDFRIAAEGERFKCPTCKTMLVKLDGKFVEVQHLVCVRQADTWRWTERLGAKTPGTCDECGEPIYFEAQNAAIERKICAQCARHPLLVREWPKGHRLFSEGGFHMQFDPPGQGELERMPAILMKIEGEQCTILAVKSFDSDEAALAWFAEQRRRFAH